MVLLDFLRTLAIGPSDFPALPKVEANSASMFDLLQFVFAVAGGLAVFYITFAGFRYTTSSGDPAAIAKAKNQIVYGIVGLVIALMAFSIVGFVLQRIG